MRGLGLCRGTRHQERVQGTRTADRQRPPEAVRHTRLVPDFVLVVVVPARVDPVIEHLPAQVLLPPANTLRMRKVDMRALAVPELADARLAGRIVPDECSACGDLAVRWMVVEQAWLQVDHDAGVLLLELVHRVTRCGEFVTVPSEHVAALANACIPGPEVERGERYVVPGRLFRELGELSLCIRSIGEAHGSIGVAEAPAWAERHPAGQLRKFAHDVTNGGPDEQVVVEITVVDLGIAVETVIVVVLGAEVEGDG